MLTLDREGSLGRLPKRTGESPVLPTSEDRGQRGGGQWSGVSGQKAEIRRRRAEVEAASERRGQGPM